ARVEPERVAVGCLGVLPGRIDEPGEPADLSPAYGGVHVDRAVLVAVVEPEQLAGGGPGLPPGGRAAKRPAPPAPPHHGPPPPPPLGPAASPGTARRFSLSPHQRDRMASELVCRTSHLQGRGGVVGVHATIALAPGCSRWSLKLKCRWRELGRRLG